MKVVSRVLAAFLIAALVLPALATPVSADIDVVSMSLRPSNSGPVGTEIRVTGVSGSDDYGAVYFEIADDDWELVVEETSGDWTIDEFLYYEDENDSSNNIYRYDFDTIDFEVPEATGGDHYVAVLTRERGSNPSDSEIATYRSSQERFTIVPKIEITSDETRGPAGTEVEVKGTGFGEEESITIYFSGVPVDVVSDVEANSLGTWTATFIVPPTHRGTHDITADGRDTDVDDVIAPEFEVTPGISIDPQEGPVGSEFTVRGSGFYADESGIKVFFNGDEIKSGVSANEDGVFQTTVTVPNASMGEHEVGASGTNTTIGSIEKRTFEVEPSFTVEPLEGHVGTEIEVSAYGLPADTAVTVSYAGDAKGTGTTDDDGTLAPITFAATHPQSTHTPEQIVTVTYNDTAITRVFEMDSTAPPTPAPQAPEAGERIGTIGKQTPTLAWSVVEDPSGVTYSLQISTTADFSQVLISKSGLVAQSSNITVSPAGTEMRYTLADTEELPYGTYYWRVKAIDGAMNESSWSSSSSFKVGLLPTWALIVIAVLAVILIAALVYVLIIRDRVGLYD